MKVFIEDHMDVEAHFYYKPENEVYTNHYTKLKATGTVIDCKDGSRKKIVCRNKGNKINGLYRLVLED